MKIFVFSFDFVTLACYNDINFYKQMTMTELCVFTEGFREPMVGVNRYGRKIAISLLSRLCKESFDLRSGVRLPRYRL